MIPGTSPGTGFGQVEIPQEAFIAALKGAMERIARLHIEKLPEGVYLATSDDIPGLVAQGRTIAETIEIARDVARKLIEAEAQRTGKFVLPLAEDAFDIPLIVGT